jgi:hypothetical protein
MKPQPQAIRSILSGLICFTVWQVVVAQLATPTIALPGVLSEEEIVRTMVRRNHERAEALGAFRGTRVYRLEYRGFPSSRNAEMVVDVKYQSPATKEFTIRSSTGSKLIIEKVFSKLLQSEKDALTKENQGGVALNNENYRFSLAGYEQTPTGSYYIFTVEPRTQNKLLYRGRIWVDSTDFAVARIDAAPAKNPSFWTKDTKIEHLYSKVGDFWLPASNRSTSTTRLGGHAVLTIEYTNYRVSALPVRIDANETIAGSPVSCGKLNRAVLQ